MPIYAYKCESCGFSKDALQKMSDAPLSVCPQCNAASFKKQLTAAGFQLKGSGWYVTDFRGGNNGAPAAKPADAASAGTAESTDRSSAAGSPSAPAVAPSPAAVQEAPSASPTVGSKSTSAGAASKVS